MRSALDAKSAATFMAGIVEVEPARRERRLISDWAAIAARGSSPPALLKRQRPMALPFSFLGLQTACRRPDGDRQPDCVEGSRRRPLMPLNGHYPAPPNNRAVVKCFRVPIGKSEISYL
jgi:hypothetical protein